jgi:hypothetical protein
VTRFFVAVLVVFCGACQRSPSPSVFVDPALAVLIPQGTTLLAGIRMERLRETSFYREFAGEAITLHSFLRRTGLDAETDIWEYLIASDGTRTVTLMRGKFSEMGLEPRSNKPGAQRISRAGVTIIGDERGAVGFLNPTTAIAGSLDAVVLATGGRHESTGVPQPLGKLIAEIASKNTLWFASTGPAPEFLPLSTVQKAAGGFDPVDRRLTLTVHTNSREEALRVAEAVEGRAEGHLVQAEGPLSTPVLDWLLGRENKEAH